MTITDVMEKLEETLEDLQYLVQIPDERRGEIYTKINDAADELNSCLDEYPDDSDDITDEDDED